MYMYLNFTKQGVLGKRPYMDTCPVEYSSLHITLNTFTYMYMYMYILCMYRSLISYRYTEFFNPEILNKSSSPSMAMPALLLK